jgi:simple sugar transport system ATP-binding protein
VGERRVPTGVAGAMADAGIAVIPEDRHDSGIVQDMTVAENLFLVDHDRVSTRGFMHHRAMHARAAELIEEFGVSCGGPDAFMWSLSGGNQQRVVLARELSHEPVVLVAAQPTHGLDVGAIEYMTDRLRRAAESGIGILLISSELEEILDLSHRIIVLFGGRVIGAMDRAEVDLPRLGRLMGGVTDEG